jgi:palmitoyltransferase
MGQSGLQTHVQTTCAIHGKPLNFYCENTESLICHDCTVMGPHNTQLHRISKLTDAFSYRFQLLNKSIHENLVPKRTQLVGQIVRLDTRLDEVKSVKQVIERDIRNEYAGIMERLKSAEGVKTAVLSHDLSEVQQDITRIDEILMFMEEITSAGPDGVPDQVAFLHHYKQLNENIEYSITKQFKVDIDVYPNDLPRELAERQLLIEHYEEQRRLLKFKDDIIWKMSQELKKKYDFYQDEFDKETRHEMEEWARLVDKYAHELKKFDMVCAFCGQHMSDVTVNTDCVENNSMFDAYTYFTEDEPAQHIIHKGRHWFGRPSQRQFTQ